ncbi:MAG: polyprenol monophosphomannose synthase [Lachnospiraceae bacterium]|nr:polyprenol monophosphomannose synthase [Lachnospiraceae bacterium]
METTKATEKTTIGLNAAPKPSISVVIPTFNERDNVGILCERIGKALEGIRHETIFVDDSNDDTPQVIEDIMKTNKNVRLYHRENGTGLATAVIDGFGMANGLCIAVMDADLQHPPEILRSMYAALVARKCDFCIPSRFIKGGSDGGLNFYRKFVSWTARWIGKIMLRSIRKISDPTSGLFMFRRECIKDADLQPIGWKIMIEVLAMAQYTRVCEIPYTFCEREHGESKLSAKVTKEYLVQVKGLRKRQVKHKDLVVKRIKPESLEKYLESLNRVAGK